MTNLNVISNLALNNSPLGNNVASITSVVDSSSYSALNCNKGDLNTFESILNAGISPINGAQNDIQQGVAELQQESIAGGNIVDPSGLLGLQDSASKLSVGVTVAAKATNLGVKFINELTHLQ